MNFSTKTLLLAIFAIILLGYGCKKDDTADSVGSDVKKISPLAAKNETTSWIDLHVAASQSESQSYELLKQNLNYEGAHVQKRKNGEDVLVIPVNNTMREKLKLGAGYALKMITVKKNGNPRWSMIVAYKAEDGSANSILSDRSIQGIVNNETLEDGTYSFFDLKGKPLYRVSLKNKKIIAYSSVQTKDKSIEIRKTMSTDKGGNSLSFAKPPEEDCTDWYWVTTYYDNNGNVEYETWDYLYTTCEGGGGGGGTPPEEPIDVEMTQDFDFSIPYTNFQPEDYRIMPGGLGGASEGSPLDYDTKVRVVFMTRTRRIVSVEACVLVVRPARETYTSAEFGTVVRNIAPLDLYRTASFSGRNITAQWDTEINFRWSLVDLGQVRSIQVPFVYTTTFPF